MKAKANHVFLLVSGAAFVSAKPKPPFPVPVIQGDGDTLSVQQHGDEYSHYGETRDGSDLIYMGWNDQSKVGKTTVGRAGSGDLFPEWHLLLKKTVSPAGASIPLDGLNAKLCVVKITGGTRVRTQRIVAY